MVIMSLKYTNKLWTITDLIKEVGKWKTEFENIADIEKLNQSHSFQSLVYHVFYRQYDSGIIIRNKMNNDRLHISICKHQYPDIITSFELYGKYKKRPFYVDTLFLDFNKMPIDNQRVLANFVLNDTMLFHFFEFERKSYCDH